MNIKIPATSANIGVGFDTLGLALNLFNEFAFTKSSSDRCLGFEIKLKNNLVYKAYQSFLKHNNKSQKVTITQIKNDIPMSRGLGSSASCILAGVLAANVLGDINDSYDNCVSFAADYEGHPDNVYAAAYGGLVSVYKEGNNYYYEQFKVNPSLCFTLVIPETKASTETLRNALPKMQSYGNIIHNLSRIIQLPKAFETGDLDAIARTTSDLLHEPYRKGFIEEFDRVKNSLKEKAVVLISGSGSTMILISKEDITQELPMEILHNHKVITALPYIK